MKIIHVREIANVAATLVDGLRRLGHQAELEPMRARRSERALEAAGIPARLLEARRINAYIHREHFDAVHLRCAYMGWMSSRRTSRGRTDTCYRPTPAPSSHTRH